MITTLSNTELEREYIVSKLISESKLPKDYTKLRLLISEIPILDTSEIFPLPYSYIISVTSDKMNLLNDDVIKDFYYGKDTKLLQAFLVLLSKVDLLIPLYSEKSFSKFINTADTIHDQLPGEGFEGIAEIINSTLLNVNQEKNYKDMREDLMKLKGKLESVCLSYNQGIEKIVEKSKTPKFDDKYQIFLQDLYTNADKYIEDGALAVTLGCTIDSISILVSSTLDPYSRDLLNNFLDVITHPKNFYKDCFNDKIISPAIGTLFYHCYPYFYKKFYSMVLDDYDKMPYQKQIQFRQAFGIPSDDSAISQLCASSMIAQPQGAT